jgi:hypothetical protein
MTDQRRNLHRPRLLTRMRHHVRRRAFARVAVELDRGARRDAGWLHLMGLSGAEAGALARELRGLATATSVTRVHPG